MAQAPAPADDTTVEMQPDGPKVLLVDDHDLFRTGLRTLLQEQGIRIVAEAADGAAAVARVREHRPDVVLMDINMPVMNGVEATREIARLAPLTRVVVLTISDRDGDVIDAILAGASGYLLKDASIDELLRGIDAAAAGDSLMSPQVAATVIQRVRASSPGETARPRAALSERELDVLRLIAIGKDNAQIARDLHISPKTVKNHISNILMKLGIENRIQAAVYAVRTGLV
jgi:DNA-binding NarL/FixJ family response regulator